MFLNSFFFHFDITVFCVDRLQKKLELNQFETHFVTQQNVERVKGCEYFLNTWDPWV
jgi:hypothetical protein